MPPVRSIKSVLCAFVASITLGSVLLLGLTAAFAQGESTAIQVPSTAIQVPVQLQAWQKRRVERLRIIRAGLLNPSLASKPFDEMLTDFETHPLAQTPMENMDLLGLFYAPKEGISKALPLIVMNAALGWYDALRFGSLSGQAEILNNEGFFKRALLLAGKERVSEYMTFEHANPEEVQAAIVEGLAFAEKFKGAAGYDHRWPTAYGLERMNCALGGVCQLPAEAPQSQWNVLWGQAKLRVRTYYQVK